MRFAFHRPGFPLAFHALSRRAPPRCCRPRSRQRGRRCPQAVHSEVGLALARLPVHLPARRAPLARVMRGSSPPPGRAPSPPAGAPTAPTPTARMPRFSPAFARTLRPGFSRVPRADRVMFVIFRSSTRISSNRRARSVEVFSTQSLRRSVSRAALPGHRLLGPPATLRAPPGAGQLALQPPRPLRSGAVRPGWCSSSPSTPPRDTTTPRSMPTAWPLPGAGIGSGIAGERDMPAPGPVPASPGRTSRPAHVPGPPEPHPPGLRHPHLRRPSGSAGERPIAARAAPRSGTPHPAPALRHVGRPARFPGRRTRPSPGPDPATPAAAPSATPQPATDTPPGPRSAAGTAPGSPARSPGPRANARAAPPPGSTRKKRGISTLQMHEHLECAMTELPDYADLPPAPRGGRSAWGLSAPETISAWST